MRTDVAQSQPQNWPATSPEAGTVAVPANVPPPMPMGMGASGPLGNVRSTGACIALCIVTLGFYSLYWYYKTHDEMKRHTNTGVGGGLALVISFFVGIVMWFLTPSEIAGMYQRRGMRSPVSGTTGLWPLLLGWCFGIGLIVWFVKVNGALNAYWRAEGVR